MAGMASAILVANQSLDVADGRDGRRIDAAEVQQDLLGDIQHALTFTERTNHAVTFLVPDRDGDGDPESIRYAWSGNAGDPLTYEYNGRPPINLADDVSQLDLSYLTQTLPAPVVPEDPGISSGNLVFVSGGTLATPASPGETAPVNLTFGEAEFVYLFTSWGFTVTVISPDSATSVIEDALGTANVAYVSPEPNTANALPFLAGTAVGIVNAQAVLTAGLGFASNTLTISDSALHIINGSHYVTSDFSSGDVVPVFSQARPFVWLSGSVTGGLVVLGQTGTTNDPALVALNPGVVDFNGEIIPGRRVQLPWGTSGLEQSDLTNDGRTLLRRALEWAAGAG